MQVGFHPYRSPVVIDMQKKYKTSFTERQILYYICPKNLINYVNLVNECILLHFQYGVPVVTKTLQIINFVD